MNGTGRKRAKREPRPGYTIRNARERDARKLHDFLYRKPDANIRGRRLGEVRSMISRGLFFMAEDHARSLVGACYIDGPGEGEGDWELGGAFVLPDHRKTGLFHLMAAAAIVNHFITMEPRERLIGHVVDRNRNPRTVLEKLGFELASSGDRYRVVDIPGLEHMPADQNGCVTADLYVFRRENYCHLVQYLLTVDWLRGENGSTYWIDLAVPALQRTVLEEVQRNCR